MLPENVRCEMGKKAVSILRELSLIELLDEDFEEFEESPIHP